MTPQNSAEVATSCAKVLTTIDTFLPVGTELVADNFAFLAFSKKNLTFFLCIMSNSTPPTVNTTMRIKNPCIANGGTLSTFSMNGLTVIIISPDYFLL